MEGTRHLGGAPGSAPINGKVEGCFFGLTCGRTATYTQSYEVSTAPPTRRKRLLVFSQKSADMAKL